MRIGEKCKNITISDCDFEKIVDEGESTVIENTHVEGKGEVAIDIPAGSTAMMNVSTDDSQSKYGLRVSNAYLQAFGSKFYGTGSDVVLDPNTIAEFYDIDANEVIDVARGKSIFVASDELLNDMFDTTDGTLRAEEIAKRCLLLINLLLHLNSLNSLVRG